MATVRRAIAFASLGRYAAKFVNFAMIAVIGRLMAPKEYGVAVLGMSTIMIFDAIREVASASYLVQQQDLTQDKINSAFTVSLCFTFVLTAAALLLAAPVAALYGEPRLEDYISVVAVAFATGPIMQPIYAMWSRDLQFRTVASMEVMVSVVNASTSIYLVWRGFSYMALAWATLVTAVVQITVASWISRHRLAKLRLSLGEWRDVVAYGLYGGASAIIFRVSEAFGLMVVGRLLSTQGVALLQRASVLASFTDNVVLSGVGAVALPAFSRHSRDGNDLKTSYLHAASLVSAVQWPVLALVSTMAAPLTLIVLGSMWTGVAPLVQIISIAFLCNFAGTLNYPVLVAAGAIRSTLPTILVQVVLSLAITVAAANFGLKAIAYSMFIISPLGFALWTRLVRRHIPFGLRELLHALRKSFIVLLASAAGPLVVLALTRGAPSVLDGALAAVVWAAGWIAAIFATRHPLLAELGRVRRLVRERLAPQASTSS